MRILIAVDLEHDAEHIVDLASAWAVRLDAIADILHVTDAPSHTHEASTAHRQRFTLHDRLSSDLGFQPVPRTIGLELGALATALIVVALAFPYALPLFY